MLNPQVKSVIVLGGYGNFGQRIAGALARKLLRDEIDVRGAMPCMGLLTTDEILHAIPGLQLSWATQTN